MDVRLNRFPGGVLKAVTMSFDDGREDDRRLVQMLNTYGLKAAFHLNSGKLGMDLYITAEEAADLYKGHEISAHSVDHPHLAALSPEHLVIQIRRDREMLEQLAGYPVRGMSYPFGTYDERVIRMLPALGIEYARTVENTGKFQMPGDFLRWQPTCHHKQMVECAERFIDHKTWGQPMELLYVWGHSFEFGNDGNWELIDRFGELIGGRSDMWIATNAEIAAYCRAQERLRFSASGRLVDNPSAMAVWISVDGDPVEIGAGTVVRL